MQMNARQRKPIGEPAVSAVWLGGEWLKQALLLLAIEPRLQGAMVKVGKGSEGALLLQLFRRLMPPAMPWVTVPLNVTEDRLLGGVDLEQTAKSGQRQTAVGLLAAAHRGVLTVAHINLLDANSLGQIAAALDAGVVQLEREGLSQQFPAHFSLLATYDAQGDEVSSLLRERVGLLVEAAPEDSLEGRTARLQQLLDETDSAAAFDSELVALRLRIHEARRHLPNVRVSKRTLRTLSELTWQLGIEGHRADWFALCAARAHAALQGRKTLHDEDLLAAIYLVLLPRAITVPSNEEHREPQVEEEHTPNRERPQRRETTDTAHNDDDASETVQDWLLQAIDARLPDDALPTARLQTRRQSSGRRIAASNRAGGRYVRATARRASESKLAIDATLRAAAPWQGLRRSAERAPQGVKITTDDLRFKQFRRRSGMLFILAVDASGSMAANRFAQAKGALIRLLQEAYRQRDKVALIRFRHDDAQVLLRPTRSVELGKRLIDALPAGGATPLAKGLLRALELARAAYAKDRMPAVIVLFTDGRANVALRRKAGGKASLQRAEIEAELQQLGAILQREAISSLVVDTKSRFVSTGEGQRLAEWLGGRYIYLPRNGELTREKLLPTDRRQEKRIKR